MHPVERIDRHSTRVRLFYMEESRRPLWKEYRDILRGYSDADLTGGAA